MACTAALAPATATPAGQQALLKALRQRVLEQQQVVEAYQARDARMAALIRGLAYQRARRNPGAAPMTFAQQGAPGGLGSPAGRGGLPAVGPGAPLASLMRSLTALPDGGSDDAPPVPGIAGDAGRAAAEAALTRRGDPYAWGAKGPNSFDCSGLTAWAWRQAGVQLGPDTYAQIRQGIPVPPDQVRPGDLIFPLDSFGEGGRRGPGHVQLAIGGRQVVHAPHTGDVVRIAALPQRFIARRPVPDTLPAAENS